MCCIKDFDKIWEEIEQSPEYKKLIDNQDQGSEGYKNNLELWKKENLVFKQQKEKDKKEDILFWEKRLKMAFGDRDITRIIEKKLKDLED